MSSKAVRETLGFLAVVAGLVFVGWEIRASNVQARAAAYQEIGIATAAAWHSQAYGLDYLTLRGKEPAEMDATEWLQLGHSATGWARLAETVWLQVEEGLLPPDAMERLGYVEWANALEDPKAACLWPLIGPNVSTSFRQFVEGSAVSNTIDCSGFAVPPGL